MLNVGKEEHEAAHAATTEGRMRLVLQNHISSRCFAELKPTVAPL